MENEQGTAGDNDRRYSTTELAKALDVHVDTVWRWIHKGVRGGIRLRSGWKGGRRSILQSDLERFEREIADTDTPSGDEA